MTQRIAVSLADLLCMRDMGIPQPRWFCLFQAVRVIFKKRWDLLWKPETALTAAGYLRRQLANVMTVAGDICLSNWIAVSGGCCRVRLLPWSQAVIFCCRFYFVIHPALHLAMRSWAYRTVVTGPSWWNLWTDRCMRRFGWWDSLADGEPFSVMAGQSESMRLALNSYSLGSRDSRHRLTVPAAKYVRHLLRGIDLWTS